MGSHCQTTHQTSLLAFNPSSSRIPSMKVVALLVLFALSLAHSAPSPQFNSFSPSQTCIGGFCQQNNQNTNFNGLGGGFGGFGGRFGGGFRGFGGGFGK